MTNAVLSDQYQAARRGAAFIDRTDRGRILVSGADRAAYLQGLLTNDIAALQAGSGCYAAYLTAQGRMIADLFVYELGDVMLLTMVGAVKDTVLQKLDQFIFSEDVQLGDVTGTMAQICVVGPAAAQHVSAIAGVDHDLLSGMPEHGSIRTTCGGEPAIVLRVTDTGEPGFDLIVASSVALRVKSSLEQAGVAPLDSATADVLRIEGGVAVFHRDMDEQTIPLEAGIEDRAISLTKGCYVGQEVIIRVLHRGHGRVAKKLVGIQLQGADVPAAASAVRAGDREIGRVTSAAMSPALSAPVALAYVQREFIEPGTAVVIGDEPGAVVRLPFVAPRR